MKGQNKVKIAFCYPPIDSNKGTPLLSQNRQFQFFNSPTFIYPMVPAYAATMLKKAGHSVFWLDGIAEKKQFSDWSKALIKIKPDFIIIESKTPVVKTHWNYINFFKEKLPKAKIILIGDHVTHLPFESFINSKVDYVIVGGDYDFVLLNLINHIFKKEVLEGGVYWRANDSLISKKSQTKRIVSKIEIYSSGFPNFKHDLDSLPFIDRVLTKWKLYAYENGNYKYTPATYLYSGRDCWWGKCTFCIWNFSLNPLGSYRVMSPNRLFAEVKYLVDKYHVKEIFDDAGTFMIGKRLKEFCQLMIDSGYNKRVVLGCNMRFNALKKPDYELMKKTNFRFLLFGMESANQKTLDKLNKGLKVSEIKKGARLASSAGLDTHATVMLGFPWESYSDAKRTISFAKKMFSLGFFNTLQATIVIPYPGTPLWQEAKEKNWLLTEDYEKYDMRESILKTKMTNEQTLRLTRELYTSFLSPKYLIRQIKKVKSITDAKFLVISGIKLIGHLLDFNSRKK